MFKCPGPIVTPVIHVLDRAQALRNIRLSAGAGVPGVFLINHDFPVGEFIPIITEVRKSAPNVWIGVNFLANAREGSHFRFSGDCTRRVAPSTPIGPTMRASTNGSSTRPRRT